MRVVHADVMTFPTDLLVLKHAQALHGLDRHVVEAMAADHVRLPKEGAHLLVEPANGLPARAVLLLGVVPLFEFEYREIRQFARRALAVAAHVRPETSDLALTLHGPGYGLDEIEAFQSELRGLADSFAEGGFPPGLRTVTFVERDGRRADRMKAQLATPRSEDADKARVFVAMPFAAAFEDLFHYGISRAIRKAGFVCERMDTLAFTGDVVAKMKERIGRARLVVADLTDANPNVYLEVGYAWGQGVPTVLICREDTKPAFDLQGHRYLAYNSIQHLEESLTAELRALGGELHAPQAHATWAGTG